MESLGNTKNKALTLWLDAFLNKTDFVSVCLYLCTTLRFMPLVKSFQQSISHINLLSHFLAYFMLIPVKAQSGSLQ